MYVITKGDGTSFLSSYHGVHFFSSIDEAIMYDTKEEGDFDVMILNKIRRMQEYQLVSLTEDQLRTMLGQLPETKLAAECRFYGISVLREPTVMVEALVDYYLSKLSIEGIHKPR